MVASLLGPNFKAEPPTLDDVKITCVVWGVTLGIGLLTAWKAVEQTIIISRRHRALRSPFLWMIWLLWMDNNVQGIICWCFMNGMIPPSFVIFFVMITTWVIQTQLTLQIIINRAALIMVNRRRVRMLKWGVGIFVGLVNISVYSIWIPARLQTSERFIAINTIWDRIEKTIFLFVDAGLNAYFLYLVKSRLIAQGLDKYKVLFNFNSCIVVISLAMDILLICMMDLKNSFSYIQFHPLAYMVKLYIELVLTELIVKVARSSFPPGYNSYSNNMQSSSQQPNDRESIITETKPAHMGVPSTEPPQKPYCAHVTAESETSQVGTSQRTSIDAMGPGLTALSIQKTVSVTVDSKSDSTASSREELPRLMPPPDIKRYSGNWI